MKLKIKIYIYFDQWRNLYLFSKDPTLRSWSTHIKKSLISISTSQFFEIFIFLVGKVGVEHCKASKIWVFCRILFILSKFFYYSFKKKFSASSSWKYNNAFLNCVESKPKIYSIINSPASLLNFSGVGLKNLSCQPPKIILLWPNSWSNIKIV